MVEATGRTRDEAIARAVAKLGIPRSSGEITVLEEKAQRFLGLFGGPLVRVRVHPRSARGRVASAAVTSDTDAERTREIVEGILAAMGVRARVTVEKADGAPSVQISTQGSD